MKKKSESSFGSQKEMSLFCCLNRFAKGEREQMVTGSDSARIYGVTNLQSYQVMKEFISRPSHAKVCKIDYASVINRNM